MQAARFRWFILISLMIHTVLLCLYGFIPPFKPKLFSPIGVDLLFIPFSPRQEASGPQEKPRGPAASTALVPGPTRTKPFTPSVKTEVPSSTSEPSSREIETSVAPGGTSSGTGLIAPGSEGIAMGGSAILRHWGSILSSRRVHLPERKGGGASGSGGTSDRGKSRLLRAGTRRLFGCRNPLLCDRRCRLPVLT